MTRLHTLSAKVPTEFGSLYTTVNYDDAGRIVEVKIFSPQKFHDSQVDVVIQRLAESLQGSIDTINGRREPNPPPPEKRPKSHSLQGRGI